MKYLSDALVALAVIAPVSTTASAEATGPFFAEALGWVSQGEDAMVFLGAVTDESPSMGLEFVVSEFSFTSDVFPYTFEGPVAFSSPEGGLLGHFEGAFVELDGDILIGLGEFSVLGGDGVFTGVTGYGDFSLLVDQISLEAQFTFHGTLVPGPSVLTCIAAFGVMPGVRRRRRVE